LKHFFNLSHPSQYSQTLTNNSAFWAF